MMATGISGMVSLLFIAQIFGGMKTSDWMLFCIWAVVAICGAIKRRRDNG